MAQRRAGIVPGPAGSATWARAARTVDPLDSDLVTDLSEPPDAPVGPAPAQDGSGASSGRPFALPPRTLGPRVAARRRRRRLAATEVAVAAVVIGSLAALGHHRPPAPLTPAQTWSVRSRPAIAALAREVALASDQPATAGADQALLAYAARVRLIGPPPATLAAGDWSRALADVTEAASASGPTRVALLSDAGLEIVGMEVAMRPGGIGG